MKKYLHAIVIAMLLTTTIYGGQISKKINVVFNAINIEVNGEKIEADNIVYEGTTYVPLRAISEKLGNEVVWVDKTKTAQINNKKAKQEYPVATINMQNGDQIKIELYPEVAPITVENFISLVKEGFYDNLVFHRVIPGFMIQGGDPNGDGSGGSPNSIKGEFASNGIKNNLSHTRGTVSMARRANNSDSGSSQFFIVHEDSEFLDGEYAGFGKVTHGMNIVDQLVNSPRDSNDKPLAPQIIKNIKMN